METMKEYISETPHGGVRMKAFFFDAYGLPCEESKAKKTQIIEYDNNGNSVFSIISE